MQAYAVQVEKKFYDNMEVQRADGFIVQTGNPGNEARSAPQQSIVAREEQSLHHVLTLQQHCNSRQRIALGALYHHSSSTSSSEAAR